jgi:hypothetical protein
VKTRDLFFKFVEQLKYADRIKEGDFSWSPSCKSLYIEEIK